MYEYDEYCQCEEEDPYPSDSEYACGLCGLPWKMETNGKLTRYCEENFKIPQELEDKFVKKRVLYPSVHFGTGMCYHNDDRGWIYNVRYQFKLEYSGGVDLTEKNNDFNLENDECIKKLEGAWKEFLSTLEKLERSLP